MIAAAVNIFYIRLPLLHVEDVQLCCVKRVSEAFYAYHTFQICSKCWSSFTQTLCVCVSTRRLCFSLSAGVAQKSISFIVEVTAGNISGRYHESTKWWGWKETAEIPLRFGSFPQDTEEDAASWSFLCLFFTLDSCLLEQYMNRFYSFIQYFQ